MRLTTQEIGVSGRAGSGRAGSGQEQAKGITKFALIPLTRTKDFFVHFDHYKIPLFARESILVFSPGGVKKIGPSLLVGVRE